MNNLCFAFSIFAILMATLLVLLFISIKIYRKKTSTTKNKLICIERYEEDAIKFSVIELFSGYEQLKFPSGATINMIGGTEQCILSNASITDTNTRYIWSRHWENTGILDVDKMLSVKWKEDESIFFVKKLKNGFFLLTVEKENEITQIKLFNSAGIRLV